MKPDLRIQNHLTDERIIALLHSVATVEEAEHLTSCAQCRSEFEGYQATLDYVDQWPVPDRGPEYGAQVWQRISGRLGARRRFHWWNAPVAAWAAVAACGLVLLLVPLLRQKPQEPVQAPALETQTPVHGRRLLQAALSDHLERASILFTHVLNDSGFARAGEGDEDELDDLIAENRLYRQTAEQQNDRETAALLSDVETVLLDLQHSPAASVAELRYVQQRISDSSLRFRLGIAQSYHQPAAGTHVRLVGRGL
jgi:hypothetical protein